MSLIHEALQKAEAERRTGELPPLLSVTAPRARPRRSPWPILATAAALILLTAAVYSNRDLLLESAGLSERAVDAATKPNQTADASVGATAPDVEVLGAAPAVKPAPVRETLPAAHDSVAPESPVVADRTVPAPITPARADVQETPQPLPGSDDAVRAAEAAAPAPPPDPIATVEVPAAAAPEPAPDATAAVPEAPAAPVATEPALPYLFELPLAARQGLPAFKVTMHVYSADSSKRFAIIDGKRVGDGGILGNELNVVEIRRDAIVIEHRGTRFMLPRLGR